MKITLFTKKDKPTVREIVKYLNTHSTKLLIYEGVFGDTFPEEAKDCSQDMVISYLSPWIIPNKILNKTKLWNINFHPGPPEYPGIGCSNFAIYNKEKSYGVTAHLMIDKVDMGKIIAVKRFPLLESDSVYSLTVKAYEQMLSLFFKVMDFILTKNMLPNCSEAWKRKPYLRKELEELCRVNAGMAKDEIERRIKAATYTGAPGAYIDIYGHRFEYNPGRSGQIDMGKVFIIAEAGINHNGSIEVAKEMVDVAVEAGTDAVKFQTFKAEKLVSRFAPKAEYQRMTTDKNESQLDMLKKLELDKQAHRELMSYCREKGIMFLSSPFDLESIDLLNELGLEIFKIPSGEITDLPYLKKIGGLGKKLILSTGMADSKEIEDALNILIKSGTKKENITVLHCNTAYLTPMEDVNLRAMLTIRDAFKVKVGYSDHAPGIEVPITAVALGATIIEKHFTLDRNMKGPDHRASLEPNELKTMIEAIRNIEKAFGDGVKRPSPSELKNKPIARKSMVAARDIKKGEVFAENNITLKRLGTGISPMRWDNVIGKVAKKDFREDELIEL